MDERVTFGLEKRVAIGLAYFFSWIGGLVFLLSEKDNREVKFHSVQSIIIGVAAFAVKFLHSILWRIPLVGSVLNLASSLLFLAGFILAILAFTGKYFEIPIVSDLAKSFLR